MINKATLMGRIGKKDTKELKNGGSMTNLYLATSRKYTDSKGDQQVITVWHNVNFFNKLADVVKKYAHVGDLVYIEGEINNKQMVNGDNPGQWHYSVTGSEIKFIPTGKKKTEESNNSQENFEDNDIPF